MDHSTERDLALPLFNVVCSDRLKAGDYWYYDELSEEERRRWSEHFTIKDTEYVDDLRQSCCVLHLALDPTVSGHDIAWGERVPKRVRYALDLTQLALDATIWAPLGFSGSAAILYEERHPIFLRRIEKHLLDEQSAQTIGRWSASLLSDEGTRLERNRRRAAMKAFQRYFIAKDRDADDDKLIDLWIGLEALFFENKDALSLRGCIKIAEYLKDLEARSTLYSTAIRSYNFRSRIVHGDDVKPEELALAVAQTQWITRVALRRVLEEFSNGGFRPDELEESFFSSI